MFESKKKIVLFTGDVVNRIYKKALELNLAWMKYTRPTQNNQM